MAQGRRPAAHGEHQAMRQDGERGGGALRRAPELHDGHRVGPRVRARGHARLRQPRVRGGRGRAAAVSGGRHAPTQCARRVLARRSGRSRMNRPSLLLAALARARLATDKNEETRVPPTTRRPCVVLHACLPGAVHAPRGSAAQLDGGGARRREPARQAVVLLHVDGVEGLVREGGVVPLRPRLQQGDAGPVTHHLVHVVLLVGARHVAALLGPVGVELGHQARAALGVHLLPGLVQAAQHAVVVHHAQAADAELAPPLRGHVDVKQAVARHEGALHLLLDAKGRHRSRLRSHRRAHTTVAVVATAVGGAAIGGRVRVPHRGHAPVAREVARVVHGVVRSEERQHRLHHLQRGRHRALHVLLAVTVVR
mmetsp:Transcript_12510/g.45619  ORF Transcript_12510/g.45619 Transcript_12510/m.45619 type:complete len:368 (+) Transcript_12510:2489-3592(+)